MGIAAITGSASGIGAAVKQRFEAEGYETIGVDIRNADIEADLSTKEGRASAVAEILTRSGGTLDRLILCAGLGSSIKPASLICRVNYFGVVDVLDSLLSALTRGTDPNAVVICSNSAQMGDFTDDPYVLAMLAHDEAAACELIDKDENSILAYMGSKNAVGRAVRRRAGEWGRASVRLNAVCPGPVNTPLLQGCIDDPLTAGAIEGLSIPLGRRGEPEDVAKTVWFLSSPEQAGWIHGSVLYVDGGNDAEIRPDRY
jgi:NAD(P)-dependent dehydrogenase (short-subunit alcohol dehydrogenase family)